MESINISITFHWLLLSSEYDNKSLVFIKEWFFDRLSNYQIKSVSLLKRLVADFSGGSQGS
jgi:hypothetical protein